MAVGIFDSGLGGLTICDVVAKRLPEVPFIYFGDNAHAPYGVRTADDIFALTCAGVERLWDEGCDLVVLACNTASAKALRSIQQKDLPGIDPSKRVLGVIRPTAEVIGNYSITKEVGVLATSGTVASGSYILEIEKFFPGVKIFQQACPLWVPLIENEEYNQPGADYFVQKCIDQLLDQSAHIDTILLACTHYPLLYDKIKKYCPPNLKILSQGEIVANSLADYMKRHSEIEKNLSRNGATSFFTTDSTEDFDRHAGLFYGRAIASKHLDLENKTH